LRVVKAIGNLVLVVIASVYLIPLYTASKRYNFDGQSLLKILIILASKNLYLMRHLDKTGVIYAEDLPKMDYLSPTIRKQILENFPSCSSNSRGKGDTLSSLLASNVELTKNVNALISKSVTSRARTQYECGFSQYVTFLNMSGVKWNYSTDITEYLKLS
jgi:hypothetical protein